ncbi:hypothetical protein Nos7524_5602 (plasmid) [Nostoc sp. PCC 7524]|nr:hypothetical protein Nos7524_5602 [Nostoc sp. PCC 7524]
MKFQFKINDELFVNILFISAIVMYFLGLVVIPNIYLYIYLNDNTIEYPNK